MEDGARRRALRGPGVNGVLGVRPSVRLRGNSYKVVNDLRPLDLTAARADRKAGEPLVLTLAGRAGNSSVPFMPAAAWRLAAARFALPIFLIADS